MLAILKSRLVKFRLKTDAGFCVLGWLCELHRQEQEGNWDKIIYCGQPTYFYLGCMDYLPKSVMDWSGIKTRSAAFATNNSLMLCNEQGVSKWWLVVLIWWWF